VDQQRILLLIKPVNRVAPGTWHSCIWAKLHFLYFFPLLHVQ